MAFTVGTTDGPGYSMGYHIAWAPDSYSVFSISREGFVFTVGGDTGEFTIYTSSGFTYQAIPSTMTDFKYIRINSNRFPEQRMRLVEQPN